VVVEAVAEAAVGEGEEDDDARKLEKFQSDEVLVWDLLGEEVLGFSVRMNAGPPY
jgi:hypothetical protein